MPKIRQRNKHQHSPHTRHTRRPHPRIHRESKLPPSVCCPICEGGVVLDEGGVEAVPGEDGDGYCEGEGCPDEEGHGEGEEEGEDFVCSERSFGLGEEVHLSFHQH